MPTIPPAFASLKAAKLRLEADLQETPEVLEARAELQSTSTAASEMLSALTPLRSKASARISSQDRQEREERAIDAMHAIVDTCYEQLDKPDGGAKGRLAVAARLRNLGAIVSGKFEKQKAIELLEREFMKVWADVPDHVILTASKAGRPYRDISQVDEELRRELAHSDAEDTYDLLARLSSIVTGFQDEQAKAKQELDAVQLSEQSARQVVDSVSLLLTRDVPSAKVLETIKAAQKAVSGLESESARTQVLTEGISNILKAVEALAKADKQK